MENQNTELSRLYLCRLHRQMPNFVIFNEFHHTSRTTSRRDVDAPETQEFRELQRLGQRLGSCSVSSRFVSVSTRSWISYRSRLRRSRAHQCRTHVNFFHIADASGARSSQEGQVSANQVSLEGLCKLMYYAASQCKY